MNIDLAIRNAQVIAILRGVEPEKAVSVCENLVDIGVTVVEIPLNSPEPLDSIERIRKNLGSRVICGAGTVTTAAQVAQIARAGAQLALSPNTDPDVIRACLAHHILPIPGIATATEAFNALGAGAKHLKIFPAGALGVEFVRALNAVLPNNVALIPVGGIAINQLRSWDSSGVACVGLGSQLFHPDDTQTQWQEKLTLLQRELQRAEVLR